ncbi:hypothetical protein NPIL_383571 [Nephila pilipes]|uniref:Uncharacterized protein n=1 Tax=Nephila pilipes TaxID=299642 RepID=A0A8X6P028_NEPPI|nr:hypothetical protein NPIL_383571 [Nephila pilipes]
MKNLNDFSQLESYLRVLETFGVSTDKCASILPPIAEYCFQEEFLKSRNSFFRCSTDAKERLANFMSFFKPEKRINLAVADLGLEDYMRC